MALFLDLTLCTMLLSVLVNMQYKVRRMFELQVHKYTMT